MTEIKMKPPFTYYGGKQKLAKEIISRIPEHVLYASVFAGGAAEFFAKAPSKAEVINDTNKELINFYKVVQNNFLDLEKLIKISLHSRSLHRDASVIYNSPHLFNDIQRAWSVWVLANQSFSSILDGSWGFDKMGKTTSTKILNKRISFTEDYAIRLQNVQIECADALYVIESRDAPSSFFYCDPPYFNSDCGHYAGYTINHFELLLKKLSSIQGKFLLSSYPSPLLEKYTKSNKWRSVKFEQNVTVNKGVTGRKKIEVMTANYPI